MSNECQDSVKARISTFFPYFRDLASVADELVRDKPTPYKYTAASLFYCCYLDGLASCRYGGEKTPKGKKIPVNKRFKKFVLNYSDEPLWLNISLPELCNFLREMGSKQETASKLKWGRDAKRIYKRLREKELLSPMRDILSAVANSARPSPYSCRGHIVKDELVQKIKCKLINAGEEPEKFLTEWEKLFEEFSYISILWWGYRCLLVHEATPLRGPGWITANRRSIEEKPYYVPVTTPAYANELRFYIPSEFIGKTLKNCLNKYEAECQKAPRSPLWWENPAD